MYLAKQAVTFARLDHLTWNLVLCIKVPRRTQWSCTSRERDYRGLWGSLMLLTKDLDDKWFKGTLVGFSMWTPTSRRSQVDFSFLYYMSRVCFKACATSSPPSGAPLSPFSSPYGASLWSRCPRSTALSPAPKTVSPVPVLYYDWPILYIRVIPGCSRNSFCSLEELFTSW